MSLGYPLSPLFSLCIRFRIGLFQNKCRAVGAAIFGKDGFVNFTVVSAYERFLVLQNHQVDMLARVTTHTMERDIMEVRIAIDLHLSFSLSLYSHTHKNKHTHGDMTTSSNGRHMRLLF